MHKLFVWPVQNILMNTWERINSELIAQKKTWNWLRKELGMTAQRVGHWNSRGVPASHYSEIAALLGKSVDWLVAPESRTYSAEAINAAGSALSEIGVAVPPDFTDAMLGIAKKILLSIPEEHRKAVLLEITQLAATRSAEIQAALQRTSPSPLETAEKPAA